MPAARSLLAGLGLVLGTALAAAACTATDSSSAPRATPRPTATPAPEQDAEPEDAPPAEVGEGAEEAASGVDDATVVERVTIEELLAIDFPLNIAHAGGDQVAPHSTLFAMERAVADGANMLELDVRLTGDGAVVVHHDDTVDGTTGGTGLVAELTLEELQALDNAYWFSPECWPCRDLPLDEYVYRGVRTGETPPPAGSTPDDFRIVTFREVVERFPTMPLDVEIKGSAFDGFAVARTLAAEIDDLGIAPSTVVVSFDDDVLRVFEQLAPDVETSPGLGELTEWVLFDEPLEGTHRIIQVPPAFEGVPVLSDTFWARAQRDNLDVWVWMDDPSRQENQAFYQELIAQGADGVIAGRPNEMAAATL